MRSDGTAGNAPALQSISCVPPEIIRRGSPVRGLRQHDQERDQRPGNDRNDDREYDHLDPITPALSFHHFRSHPAKRAAGRIAAGMMPGTAERDVRLRTEKMVGRREMAIAPRAAVVPRELVFGF